MGNTPTKSSSTLLYPSDVDFVSAIEDVPDCFSCHAETECSKHEHIATSLARTINQTKLLTETFKPYSRHYVIIEGEGKRWAPKIGKGEGDDSLTASISKEVRSDDGSNVIVTAGEMKDLSRFRDIVFGEESSSKKDVDLKGVVLVFPDYVFCTGLTTREASSFAKFANKPGVLEGIAKGTDDFSRSVLASYGIEVHSLNKIAPKGCAFVCVHKLRDNRCGIIGPMLLKEFNRVVTLCEIDSQTLILGVSHFGGHKVAGNAIIYTGDRKTTGDWYGRLIPCHIEGIVKQHLLKGRIVKEFWRGRIHYE